jgi:cell division septation protein DedD
MKKTSILFLILASIFLATLIFIAGMIVGNRLPRPAENISTAKVEATQVAPVIKPPVQPIPPEKIEPKKVAEPVSVKPEVQGKKPAEAKLISKKPKHLIKSSARKTPIEEVGDSLKLSPAPEDEKILPAHTKTKTVKSGPGKKVEEMGAPYSIGVGKFLQRDDAEKLVAELKTKNHEAYIVNAWDGRGQLWSTVRIGHFSDLDQAAKIALELKQKERLMTYLQGMGTLGFVDISYIPEPKTAKTSKMSSAMLRPPTSK